LTKSEHAKLEEWLKNNKESKILSINGFTDNDGSDGYNDTLSAKRVEFVYQKIKDKIKIRNDFKKLHFGKLHKLSDNKAENRRVTIFYLIEKELELENQLIPVDQKEVFSQNNVIEYPNFIVITNPDGTKTELNLDANLIQKIGNSKKVTN
jgi:hypothetical protein